MFVAPVDTSWVTAKLRSSQYPRPGGVKVCQVYSHTDQSYIAQTPLNDAHGCHTRSPLLQQYLLRQQHLRICVRHSSATPPACGDVRLTCSGVAMHYCRKALESTALWQGRRESLRVRASATITQSIKSGLSKSHGIRGALPGSMRRRPARYTVGGGRHKGEEVFMTGGRGRAGGTGPAGGQEPGQELVGRHRVRPGGRGGRGGGEGGW